MSFKAVSPQALPQPAEGRSYLPREFWPDSAGRPLGVFPIGALALNLVAVALALVDHDLGKLGLLREFNRFRQSFSLC